MLLEVRIMPVYIIRLNIGALRSLYVSFHLMMMKNDSLKDVRRKSQLAFRYYTKHLHVLVKTVSDEGLTC
jgi:hypothetical protein